MQRALRMYFIYHGNLIIRRVAAVKTSNKLQKLRIWVNWADNPITRNWLLVIWKLMQIFSSFMFYFVHTCTYRHTHTHFTHKGIALMNFLHPPEGCKHPSMLDLQLVLFRTRDYLGLLQVSLWTSVDPNSHCTKWGTWPVVIPKPFRAQEQGAAIRWLRVISD